MSADALMDFNDAGRLARTRARLLKWGRQNFRQYSWRAELDPWLTFMAEFLLQRTRADQVEQVFVQIRKRYPTAESLARATADEVPLLTASLGLHRRGEQLVRIATAVAARGGSPPDDLSELRRYRGVGMYTAAAWLSLHRGRRAAIVDANVARWLSRMTGGPYNRDPRHLRWVLELADGLTPQRAFRDYNYAVLDFTMTVCTPRHPSCAACPMRTDCHRHQSTQPAAR